MTFPVLSASNPSGYNLNRSLRFRSSASAYLNRTFGTATSQSIFTFSAWVKRGKLGATQTLFGCSTSQFDGILFNTSDQLVVYSNGGVGLTTSAVYRDPSAWYHLVYLHNGTSNTIYINGVSVGTGTFSETILNTANSHIIGQNSSSNYFDGYLTEINFIDGQALTPSSFGAYNAITGVWQPIKYTGTYGTNGFYLPFSLQSQTSYAASFNGSSQYLTVPDNNAWAFSGNFTLEAFFYVTTTSPSFQSIVSQWVDGGGTDRASQLGVNSSGQLSCAGQYGANQYSVTSPSSSIKTNTWYHAAMVVNGTTMTLYLNGVAQGSTTVSGSLNNSTAALGIGAYGNASWPLAGQLSNVRITNTAVYTSNFTPPVAALTAVSGTQLLTLQNATIVDNSTNAFTITNVGTVTTATTTPFAAPNIADDVSGNNNNWLANNISLTAGTTYDSMTDVPTLTSATAANYAVLNPITQPYTNTTRTTIDGNLNGTLASSGAGGSGTFSTIGMSTGSWYAEFTVLQIGSGTNLDIGILQQDQLGSLGNGTYGAIGYSPYGYSVYQTSGAYANNNASSASGTSYTTNDIVQVAFNASTGKLWFGKNGTFMSSGDPVAGTNPAFSSIPSNTYLFAFGLAAGVSGRTVQVVANFGQRPFSYTPPTGFVALNTYNLPTPTISNGANYFAATTYTGNGSTQNILNSANTTTGVSFKPDFVWTKDRSATNFHSLYDVLRGTTKALQTNTTTAEQTFSNSVTAFNSNGFTAGGYADTNGSGDSYVAWQWQAGAGSSSSNTNGSITSTVSVNATAGFSVVTFTSQASGTATIGHGLGVAPTFIITRGRNGAYNWYVYHSAIGNTKYLELNGTLAATVDSTQWNNTSPTSTVFTLGTGSAGSIPFIAYCWTDVAGFSKFGSYTGNGSADGTFVYTGFRPRFVLFKRTDTTSNWLIIDSSRGTYNSDQNRLFPNLSNAEDTSENFDLLSNGFKLRDAAGSMNASGGTYIFAAFAENPFKNSLAR